MCKAEKNTPFNAVDIERFPDGKTRVILHDNIASEVRSDEGVEHTVYTADEVAFITSEEITPEYAAEHFADLWYYAENGEFREDFLRKKRKTLLSAWDILAGNVGIGAIVITPERAQVLIAWRQDLLDLKADAFESIPPEVARFLK